MNSIKKLGFIWLILAGVIMIIDLFIESSLDMHFAVSVISANIYFALYLFDKKN